MSDADPIRTDPEMMRLREKLDEEAQSCSALQTQLDRANREFEEFVSVASHNLRESLREVAAYSQLLAETHAARLEPDAGEMLQRIRSATSDMQSLLTDIVDYWTTAPDTLRPARTDMEAVLRQALLVTARLIADRGAVISHDPLPEVKGDFVALAKVLQHLIRNAVQYCATSPCRIHISSAQANGKWVLSVRDNGPGIDTAFQARIFGPFIRLHGREYPGNGMGLAFCRKVIGLLGGQISVTSTPGAGSTFHFTLPPTG
jgi:chemotaxis family two-component system sensor kinase Cph1